MDYRQRMNHIFTGDPNVPWQHASLRTLFDPVSHEWSETTMAEKADILRTIVASGESLWLLAGEYQEDYRNYGRPDIAEELVHGLSDLLEHVLKQQAT